MTTRTRRRLQTPPIVSILRKRGPQCALNDDETTSKRSYADLGNHNEDGEQLQWERSSCDSSEKGTIADPHMQSGTSEDEEAALGDRSDDQQDISSVSESDEMEELQDLQKQLDLSHLDFEGMKSMYEDKCTDHKKLQRMYQKSRKEISALKKQLKQNEELKRMNYSAHTYEIQGLQEDLKAMHDDLEHQKKLNEILEKKNCGLMLLMEKCCEKMKEINEGCQLTGERASDCQPKLENCNEEPWALEFEATFKNELVHENLDFEEFFGFEEQCNQIPLNQDQTGQGQVITEREGQEIERKWFSEIDKSKLPPVSDQLVAEFISGMAGCWDIVGAGLGVGDKVKCIRHSHGDAGSKCLEVIHHWIDCGKDVTWIKLLDVLERLELVSLAHKIEQRITQFVSI